MIPNRDEPSTPHALPVLRLWSVYAAIAAVVYIGVALAEAWLTAFLSDWSAVARAIGTEHVLRACGIAVVMVCVAIAARVVTPAPSRAERIVARWLAVPLLLVVIIPLVRFYLLCRAVTYRVASA